MEIRIARTEADIAACYPIMKELRQDIAAETFVVRVRALEAYGYQLACIMDKDQPVAVAGFRLGESLAWGCYMYVDDLVTASDQRSRGFGSALLSWLFEEASSQGCAQIHLDSGIQRKDAHRFYEREGMQMASYHFARLVGS